MNKYKISDYVEIDKSNNVMDESPFVNDVIKFAAMAFPVVGVPVAEKLIINKMIQKDIKEISTKEELDTFSCVENKWKHDCIYIEHPRNPKRLIEARLYKDYILREIMSEMFDYITDNIPIKKIILGLENKGKIKTDVAVPINDLVAEASVSGSLNSNYILTAEDINKINTDCEKNYQWLKYYPDIVSAVKKNAGKLEIKQCVKIDLEVDMGIGDIVKEAFGSEKEYNFYVYYIKP